MSRTGRPGFDLHVLHFQIPDVESTAEQFSSLQTRYPGHEYSVADLANVGEQNSFENKNISLHKQIESLPSATARVDLLMIHLCKCAAAEAHRLGCESVLWGHSTTRLAEKILSETSKGRGGTLPFATQDGPTPYGMNFMYPMRDLMRKEIETFAAHTYPSLVSLYQQPPEKRTHITSKGTTIDGLVKDYFASVEQSYPSIVANVVRTSGKLSQPELEDDTECCGICKSPLLDHKGYCKDRAGVSPNAKLQNENNAVRKSWVSSKSPDRVTGS
ncbi:MAG: hypothetical protein Q9162_000831 [Coniocarpon cinnabarinum]